MGLFRRRNYISGDCSIQVCSANAQARAMLLLNLMHEWGFEFRTLNSTLILCIASNADQDSEHFVISAALLLVQVETVLSKLPLVSVHWKLKLQSGTVDPQLPAMTPAAPRERSWVDVPVGEECVVQIEVVRRCLRGKVPLQSCLHFC